MFGVVCTDPITGCNEPWTIAGPTDGSTNIVHHEENGDYQLATAIDDQYGASYLGISACCKPLYNPTTGNLTVDCATTTATGVDVNADDNVDVAHPIIAQNYDCDDAEYKNKLIKATCFNYNPQCYVCNDPITGCPVRKPVVHISSLCADEYLGFNEGLPRRTNVCEDCWRQIPFIGEDNGEETLDTSWSYDTFRHNSCTCTTQMEHLEIADICMPGDIYVGNRVFNPNMFEFSIKDPTNTFNTTHVGFTSMTQSFDVCQYDTTNNRCRYRLSLNENSSAIGTNSLTIAPTSGLSLDLTLTSLPYTCNTENTCYTPMAINSSYGTVKKMDGFSYDPATCYLCGNFCGNINVWPYVARWSGTGTWTDGCACVDVDAYGFEVTNIKCNSSTTLTTSKFTAGCDAITLCTNNACLSVNNTNWGMCACSNAASLTTTYETYIDAGGYARLTGCSGVILCSGLGNILLSVGRNTTELSPGATETTKYSNDGQCATIRTDYNEFKFTTCCNDSVIAIHDLYTRDAISGYSNRLAVCCDANVGWQAYALMCDIASAGGRSQITAPSTLTCLFTALGDVNGTPTHINDSHFSFAVTDSNGNTITVCHLLGFITRPESTRAQFVGLAVATNSKRYHLDMWFGSNGVVECDWTLITPVPGTLYGCATDTTVNVLGSL